MPQIFRVGKYLALISSLRKCKKGCTTRMFYHISVQKNLGVFVSVIPAVPFFKNDFQKTRLLGYLIYFWMNEGNPREPVHVHITEGTPSPNSTKIWITQKQKCIVASNEARIPHHTLNLLLRVIEGRAFEIISKWQEIFGEIRFYC